MDAFFLNGFAPDATNRAATGGEGGFVGGVGVWGDFEVHFDQVLGRGGMGTVYRGRQRSLDRPVAVKVLDLSRAPDPELADGIRAKFRNEALAMALVDDPRVVRVLGAGEDDGRSWYAMELVEGRTAERRLSEDGAFPEPEAVRVALEVARALEAVLRRGIVHRDVKPGNIFLLPDGAVKLGDFGLARGPGFAPTRLTEANAVACTPAYASPEHAEGRPSDHRADIYSLGCVLYEMLTERPPFTSGVQGDTLLRHATEPPPSPRLLNPGISPALERLILKCLEKDPADRYQTYGELIEALEGIRGGPPPAGHDRFWPAAAAAGATLLGAILVAIFTAHPSPTPERPVPLPAPAAVLPDSAPPATPPEPEAPPPDVRRPGPGEFPLSPPREETPEFILAHHRPSAGEKESLERILAAARAALPGRMEFRFDPGALSGLEERESGTPWVAILAAADRERVEAAARAWAGRPRFQEGQNVVLPLRTGRVAAGAFAGEDGEGLTLEVSGSGRETIPWRTVSPAAFFPDPLARAGAGGAAGALAEIAALPEFDRARHAPGVVDQAVEEVFLAAGTGDFGPLRGLEIPAELRKVVEGLLEARLRRLETEREAAELLERRDFPGLMGKFPGTLAAARAAEVALEDFLKVLPWDSGHELVGEIPWGTWAVDGTARYDGASRVYVLSAPGETDRAWLKRKFRGARRGYRLVFRRGDEETAVFAVALSSSCWIDLRRGTAGLFRTGAGGAVEPVKEIPLPEGARGGAVTVVPLPALVLVYLDGRLLFALPGAELEEGMRLGAGGGTVIVESIRVRDRSR